MYVGQMLVTEATAQHGFTETPMLISSPYGLLLPLNAPLIQLIMQHTKPRQNAKSNRKCEAVNCVATARYQASLTETVGRGFVLEMQIPPL